MSQNRSFFLEFHTNRLIATWKLMILQSIVLTSHPWLFGHSLPLGLSTTIIKALKYSKNARWNSQIPMKNVRNTTFVNRYNEDDITLNTVSPIHPRTVCWFHGSLKIELIGWKSIFKAKRLSKYSHEFKWNIEIVDFDRTDCNISIQCTQ